ncbi:MAG TPA: hypothetical protein PLV68_14160, partial [Ilumatobacteraceae bacterium]|nr:hypothetical protein [Ilumatobacteraceae bacterium]
MTAVPSPWLNEWFHASLEQVRNAFPVRVLEEDLKRQPSEILLRGGGALAQDEQDTLRLVEPTIEPAPSTRASGGSLGL